MEFNIKMLVIFVVLLIALAIMIVFATDLGSKSGSLIDKLVGFLGSAQGPGSSGPLTTTTTTPGR